MQSTNDYVSAYRIVAPRWVDDAFSGEGALKYGGRWNSPGQPMVYCGGTRALAALEMLVHLTTPQSRTKPYKLLELKIPANLIDHYPATALPLNWRRTPASKPTMEIGDDWLLHGKNPAISIPSILIPEERNLLLNPLHPEFRNLKVLAAVDFSFDSRL